MYGKKKVAKIYRKFVTATMALVFVAAGVATATFSFSWFTNKNNIINSSLSGKTAGAYFARGTGASNDPYVINKPIHLYNLAWLQYIGYFKGETYFIIESDLDMDGWTLPPIGTTEHPFIGHLDGYDETYSKTSQSQPAKIKNLTISNNFEDLSSRHPGSVTSSTFATPNITGLFGVVGDKSSTIEPTIQNLYLDKITVKSNTANALTGIVAGYVNGKLDNINLSDSSLEVKDGTQKLSGYDNISKYTSVGYCEEKYQTKAAKYKTTMYEPAYVGDASFNPSGGGSGDDNDWGGTVSIYNLSRRMTYIINQTQEYKNFMTVSEPKRMGLNSIKYGFKKGVVLYEREGASITIYGKSYFPLNVDTETEFQNETKGTFTKSGRVFGYATTDFFSDSNNTSEKILASNPGFITTTSKEDQTYHYIDNNGKVGASLGFDKSGNSYNSGTYNENNLVMLNIDSSGNLSRIIDGDNTKNNTKLNDTFPNTIDSSKLSQYANVKAHMAELLANDNNYIYTLAWNTNSTDTISGTFRMDSKDYDSVLAPGIDFIVHNSGYITAVFCANANYGGGNKLFSLYKVTRSSSEVTKTKISDVIPSSTGDNFDTSFAMLYLQIPVDAGEYFISSDVDSSASTSAGFMYLDIGANAGGGESGTKVQRTKVYEVLEQINEAFTYPTGISVVSFDNAVLDTKTLCVTLGSSYSGKASIKRTSKTAADIVVTTATNTGLYYFDSELTVTNNSKTINDSELIKGEETTTKTRRLTYLDYYKETKITNMYAFEQTLESNSTTWSDITLEEYTSGEGNTDFSSTSGLTIYGDEGESITTSDITIEDPATYGSETVFSLTLKENKPDDFSINYLPVGTIDETTYKFDISGYKFTLNNVTNYTLTSRNTSYSLNINGTDIS